MDPPRRPNNNSFLPIPSCSGSPASERGSASSTRSSTLSQQAQRLRFRRGDGYGPWSILAEGALPRSRDLSLSLSTSSRSDQMASSEFIVAILDEALNIVKELDNVIGDIEDEETPYDG